MSDSASAAAAPASAPVSPHPVAPGAVCVLGLGLIGGSLLRRVEQVAPGSVFGWNRSQVTVDDAARDGHDVSSDLTATLERAARQDALIVVGVPMPAVPGVLREIAAHAPGAAVTDVVSVKGPVLEAVREVNGADAGAAGGAAGDAAPALRYVGGHPMAGTNRTGWAATDPGLFDGAVWVVGTDDCGAAPDAAGVDAADADVTGCDPQVQARVAGLAQLAGSRVVALDAATHDRAVARISHLPHVLAEALAVAGAGGGDIALELGAGSFRDGTRVAGTPAELVRAICEPNRDALAEALEETIGELQQALDTLRAGGTLGDLVDRGHAARAAYEQAHGLR